MAEYHAAVPERAEGGWIGVDLDGTLAHLDYEEEYVHTEVGRAIPLMCDRVRRWLMKGVEVRIVTARVAPPIEQVEKREVVQAIDEFCHREFGTTLRVTCMKDPQMRELWDDRARQVERNSGRAVVLDRMQSVEVQSDREMKLVLNSVRCLDCKQVLISSHRHDYRVCECENQTMCDGGMEYLRRGGKDLSRIEERSLRLLDGQLRLVSEAG